MPTQPPDQWTNFTFKIPSSGSEMQLTALLNKNSTYDVMTMTVPYFSVNLEWTQRVEVSFLWWGRPWILYVGWRNWQQASK